MSSFLTRYALIVMPRLDLGISRRKITIPAPERWRKVVSPVEVTPGDAKT
jgi:hypothetical protein